MDTTVSWPSDDVDIWTIPITVKAFPVGCGLRPSEPTLAISTATTVGAKRRTM
jgi:hypothetical protein